MRLSETLHNFGDRAEGATKKRAASRRAARSPFRIFPFLISSLSTRAGTRFAGRHNATRSGSDAAAAGGGTRRLVFFVKILPAKFLSNTQNIYPGFWTEIYFFVKIHAGSSSLQVLRPK
jgi:hypothetical protein